MKIDTAKRIKALSDALAETIRMADDMIESEWGGTRDAEDLHQQLDPFREILRLNGTTE